MYGCAGDDGDDWRSPVPFGWRASVHVIGWSRSRYVPLLRRLRWRRRNPPGGQRPDLVALFDKSLARVWHGGGDALFASLCREERAGMGFGARRHMGRGDMNWRSAGGVVAVR
ncbi:hypothetical protein KCP69_00760 [Salmonella enterica subsp. enterica]|nr:hypothetical protein KCP69_00760 [Salmonella enterica subsp. enterica]